MSNTAQPAAAKPKRRWFQYSLRTLLLLALLVGLASSLIVREMREVRTICWDVDGTRLLSVKEFHGQRRIRLEHGSSYITMLPRDSRTVQDETKRGKWLIYIWAEWNTYEYAELLSCAKSAEQLGGTVAVGARPYVRYSDIPAFDIGPYRTPYWVVLSDGKILGEKSGLLTPQEVTGFVRQALGVAEGQGQKATRRCSSP